MIVTVDKLTFPINIGIRVFSKSVNLLSVLMQTFAKVVFKNRLLSLMFVWAQ